MVNQYRYEFTQNLGAKVADLIEATIGRRPEAVSYNSSGRKFSIIFDEPDLTVAERTAVRNAMPAWVLNFYDVKRTVEEKFEP